MTFHLINLDESHLTRAARLWEDGWHEAHSKIVPNELVMLRTSESFQARLEQKIETARVCVSEGAVLGLCMTQKDELYQMYVAPQARGQRVAQTLIADAENHIFETGYTSAWLACVVGNERAARFYGKSGWHNTGIHDAELDTSDGFFTLPVWRFEKNLTQLGSSG